MRHSKRWKQRYGEYLRKTILPGATQRCCLTLWIDEFRNAEDQTGKPVFTRKTEKVATEQLKKVHHASDTPSMDMYQELPPGPRSTHGLSKWRCDRPESCLEKFHEMLAHYGNSGMNKGLADDLTLGGTTEFNCRMRWKATINKRKLAGEIVDIPLDFVDLPRYYDHSFLHHLNQRAKNCGLASIFYDLHMVGENNGEVYLSKYYEEQMVRNKTVGQDKKTAMCQCPTCIQYMAKTRTMSAETRTNDNNDNGNDNDDSNDMLDLPDLPVVTAAPLLLLMRPPSTPRFVPPIPLAHLAWLPRPHDCCNIVAEYHCPTYAAYLRRKYSGLQVLGKPPHDSTCPVRRWYTKIK